jgi:hypothetical protein
MEINAALTKARFSAAALAKLLLLLRHQFWPKGYQAPKASFPNCFEF